MSSLAMRWNRHQINYPTTPNECSLCNFPHKHKKAFNKGHPKRTNQNSHKFQEHSNSQIKKNTHTLFSENLEQCKYHPHFWARPAAVNPSINGRWLLVQILLHGTLCSFFLSFTFLVAFFGLFYVSLWFLCFVTLNTFNEEIEFAIVKGFTKTGFFVFNSENELKQVILSILWRFITGSRKINFPGAPQGSHGER